MVIFLAVLLAALTVASSGASSPATAMADYATIPLDRLIGISQLIVAGDVVAVKDGTFTLRVTSTLAGNAHSPTIEVSQFIPSRFEGGSRLAPYRSGQSFLLFLVTDPKQPQKAWRILGAGGEGEMPMEDGFVYFHARNVEGLPFASYRVHGSERKVQRADAKAFCNAIKGYRACFQWKPGSDERTQPTGLCAQDALDRYSSSSEIHRHLAQLTAKRSNK